MAKRNESANPPQARHGRKPASSRHDKRQRLGRPNPKRQKTMAAAIPLVGPFSELASSLQSCLDARLAFQFSIILAGALLAKGRRTASRWFRAAGVAAMPVCSTCQLRRGPVAEGVLESTVRTNSAWSNEPDSDTAGNRSPTIAAAWR